MDTRGSPLARLDRNDRRRAARRACRCATPLAGSAVRLDRRDAARAGGGDRGGIRSAWPRWSRSGTSRTNERYRSASSFSRCRLLVWRHVGRPASPGCGSWSSRWSSGRCGRSRACRRVFGHFPGVHESNLRRYGEVVVPLAGAVLAAGGIQALIRGSRTAAIACTVAVLVPVAVWAGGGLGQDDARPALVFAVLTAAACSAVLRWPWLAFGLAVVVFVQFRSLTPTSYTHPYDPFSPRPFAAYLQKHLQPGERVVGSDRILTPNISGAMRIADPRANDALFPERWTEYMRGLVGRKTTIRTRDADSPFLDAAGVGYVLLLPGVRPSRPGFQLVYRSPRVALPGHLAQLSRVSEGVDSPIDRRRVRRGPVRCAPCGASGADLRAVSSWRTAHRPCGRHMVPAARPSSTSAGTT